VGTPPEWIKKVLFYIGLKFQQELQMTIRVLIHVRTFDGDLIHYKALFYVKILESSIHPPLDDNKILSEVIGRSVEGNNKIVASFSG